MGRSFHSLEIGTARSLNLLLNSLRMSSALLAHQKYTWGASRHSEVENVFDSSILVHFTNKRILIT